MLASVNAERKKAGLKDLCYSKKLDVAAKVMSEYNALGRVAEGRSFRKDLEEKGPASAHVGKNGSQVGDRAKDAGYVFTHVAENVAYGQPTVEVVMVSWMNSPGHKANILTAEVKHAGFSKVKDKDGAWNWTQVFGKNDDACDMPA